MFKKKKKIHTFLTYNIFCDFKNNYIGTYYLLNGFNSIITSQINYKLGYKLLYGEIKKYRTNLTNTSDYYIFFFIIIT